MIVMRRMVVMTVCGQARLAMEGQMDQAPRVEAREERGDHQQPEGECTGIAADGIGRLDDRVLGEEAGKTQEFQIGRASCRERVCSTCRSRWWPSPKKKNN